LIEKKIRNELTQGFKSEPKILEYINTKDYTQNIDSKVPLSEPMFEAIPNLIVFSDYEALKIKTIVFKLRNKDSVSRRVKIMQPETNLFKICSVNEASREETEKYLGVGNKVAPGLEISFLVRFSPETKNDYMHELVVVTEREKFVVPIYAIGKKALLDFPDTINFGNECPVKYNSEKSVILHNRGDKATKWELKLPDYFGANKTEGLIEENSTEQILLNFFPLQNKAYEELGKLTYDGDEASFVLKGNAINGEVYLSKEHIRIDETYISLESKQTFKIVNKSTVKIDFEWRAFSSEKEETDKKRALSEQLDVEENEKRKIISEMIDLEENIEDMDEFREGRADAEGENSFEDGLANEREVFLKRRKKAEMLLERKYKTIRKALEEDTFVFEDDIFSVQPIRGSIWPNSEMVITVIFKPRSALRYTHKGYCNVSCSDERLPLHLEGEGLGPKAFLSTNILSIGDIFVNDKQSYNLYIENKGEIPAHFMLVKNSSSSTNIITFDSEEGVLAVGQRMNMLLTFQSFRVGEFQEMFKWRLEGSSELLTLLVRGHVRSPRFEFDKKVIEFKKVSYQFEEVQDLLITNTSSVMFTFSLRIPQDGKGSSREFEVIPSTDSILPGEAKKVLVKFVPHYRKVYNLVLVLDMEGIGKDMKTIPITAEADVPKVKLTTDTLDFGDIFLRYPQTKQLELVNESKLYARFVIHPVNPKFFAFGKITTDMDKGQIPPESSVHLNLGLTTCCLKNFQIDLVLEIISDTNEQHLIKIKGNSIGPIVELSVKELDFGDREVLEKHVRKLTITNRSIIEADFYAFTKNPNSIFRPIQDHSVLKAGQSLEVDVVCIPDDNQKFVDTLFFVIKEGLDKEVKLKAKGVGSTIFCKDISVVCFGVLYTHRTQMQEVFIENKGRKMQTLKWVRKTEGKAKADEKTVAVAQQATADEKESFVFGVYPESIVLPAKTGLVFQFRAHSVEVGKIREQFVLTSSLNNDRKSTTLFTTTFEGEFIRPQLTFNKKAINFQYVWEPHSDAGTLSQDLEVLCSSPLPTSFTLFIEPPFTVCPDSVSLNPGKKTTVRVDFDPTLKKDRVSGQIADKLWIRHLKHPKSESFPVTAEFCYPNLAISTEEIDFGAVMNDTIKKYPLTMRNTSFMPLTYSWYFIEAPDCPEPSEVSLNEVFDILPLRGTIEPNSEEHVEFVYFAMSNRRFNVVAMCKVEGGPDYFISVKAEASNVAYNLSLSKRNKTIDIGETYLGTKAVYEFEVENTSKVMFDFSIQMDLSFPKAKIMSDFISFSPSKGVLCGGEKTKVRLLVSPGFPGELSQCLILQIGHFEPERIHLKGFGLFPSLRLDARRRVDSELVRVFQKMHPGGLSPGNPGSQPGRALEHSSDNTSRFYQSSNDIKQDQAVNPFENAFMEMKNESVVEVERMLIKNFIKQNRMRLVSEEKKSMLSNNTKSQTKLVSSTQILAKEESQGKVRLIKNDLKLFEEIVLGVYVVNLGTIIAGNKASRSLKVTNVGKCPVSFAVDMKGYKAMGLTISNTKVHKLMFSGNNNSVSLQLALQTKKTTKPGKQSFSLCLNVESGAKYVLEISAFVTVPELSVSSEVVDFGVVQIGLSKKIFVRLENTKEISCEWTASSTVVSHRQLAKKEEACTSRISIMPNHGCINPGGKKVVELCFDPNEHRPYEEIISVVFKDSTRKVEVVCKGEGVVPAIEYLPPLLVFPPCMPKTTVFRSFTIRNNSDFEISLVASDKDAEVFNDEKMLAELQHSSVRAKVRRLNECFWEDLMAEIETAKAKRDIESQIEELEAGKAVDWVAKVVELQAALKERVTERAVPPVIPLASQDNVVVVSQFSQLAKCLAEFIQEQQLKCALDLNALLEWNVAKGSAAGQAATEHLRAVKAEIEVREAERKRTKARRGAESERVLQLGLTVELFEGLLRERLRSPDCNAGVVVYRLGNDLLDLQSTVQVIGRVLGQSNLVRVEVRVPEEVPGVDRTDSQVDSAGDSAGEGRGGRERQRSEVVGFMMEVAAETKLTEEQKALVMQSLEDKWEVAVDNAEEFDSATQLLDSLPDHPPALRVHYLDNLTLLHYAVLQRLPRPRFPDPNNQPLPEPQEFQLVRKTASFRKPRVSKDFHVLTPLAETEAELARTDLTAANWALYLSDNQTRWVLQPHSSVQLFVRFSSECLGEFADSFTFENYLTVFNGLQKPFSFAVKALTEFPGISKTLANVFTNRRKNRPKNATVANEFILSENVFEFGPLLLIGKSQSTKAYVQKRHSALFRLSNACNYPITVSLMLQSEINDFSCCPALQSSPGVFEVEHQELTIGTEPVEARVWCFPKAVGPFSDSLVCVVKHNPLPFRINMQCEGIMPSVSVSVTEVVFDRILVDKRATSSFDIRNDCLIQVKWRVVNFAELQKQGFELSKESAELEVGERGTVEVSFMTKVQEKKNCQLLLECEDCQGLGIKMREHKVINLVAEGFKVSVAFSGFKSAEQMLIDFGVTLVDFPVESTVGIKNEGIYPVGFQVEVPKALNNQHFEVAPCSGELLPNATANIVVRFTAKKEVSLDEKQKGSCLMVKVIERNDVFNQVPVFLRAQAHFAKASIEPSKALSFGPVSFYETKVKSFEVTNTGQFEMAYQLFEFENAGSSAETRKRFEGVKAEQLAARAKAKDRSIVVPKQPKAKTDKLTIGQFSVSPVSGNLMPGQTQKFEVSFKGQGAAFYETKIGFEHSNRNPSDSSVSHYVLCAESCVPCLETQNFRVIFEEQVVTQSLTSTGINIQSVVNSNIFSIEDNAFYFGNIVPTQNPEGITERIKIINNGKVFANVKFDALKKGQSLFAYDVFPKQARINPHESVFVKISFKPEIMAQYEGVFSAVVENGDASFANCKLTFDLKGEGTLPSLNVMPDGLVASQASNEMALDLGRVRLGKSKRAGVSIKNIGVIPATFQGFFSTASACFKMVSTPERTLMPLEQYQFQLEFAPTNVGKFETRTVFCTLNNPYEKSAIAVKGECVDEVCAFEEFEGEDNVIDFGDIMAMPSKEGGATGDKSIRYGKRRFVVKNFSNETLRVEFAKPDDLPFVEIRPAKAHIPAKMSRKVMAVLLNPAPFNVNSVSKDIVAKCCLVSLRNKNSQIQKLANWDSSKTTKRMVTAVEQGWLAQTEELKAKFAEERVRNPKAKEPVYPPCPSIPNGAPLVFERKDSVPEPDFDILPGFQLDNRIRVTARIDVPKVVVEHSQVVFKATKMFSSRVFTFKVTNNSSIGIPFVCEFFNQRISGKDGGPFAVSPESGQLPKNGFTEFLLRFAPVEFETVCSRTLIIRIGNSEARECEFAVAVEGEVQRPICHFELPYTISDLGEKLIEIETLGINTKVARKFHVVNPTLLGYEFMWSGNTAKAVGFKCLTQKGVILPGKKFEMAFEFSPDAAAPEKQVVRMVFQVPQLGLTENFVFMTKVMQPKVFFLTSKIDFGPLLLSGKSKEVVMIKNLDQSVYSFAFSKAALKGTGPEHLNSLRVSPMSGQLLPGQDTPVTLTFCPKMEIDFNFNLQVAIPQKKEPLTLNVKGRGYKLHHDVRLNQCSIDSRQKHSIEFGEMFVHEYRKKTIEVVNSGDFNIDFVLSKKPTGTVTVQPESGTVRKGEQAQIEVVFQSVHNTQLQTEFELQVVSGPTYAFVVSGTCKSPLVELSPKTVDFGQVILKKSGVSKTALIECINLDKKTLSIESDFTKNEFIELKMPFGQTLLPFEDKRDNVVKLPLTFKPTVEGKFSATLNFFVNGRHKIEVVAKGEAINFSFELSNPQDMLTDFGVTHLGSKQSRPISLKNFSKLPMSVRFDVDDQLAKMAALGLSLSPTTLSLPKRAQESVEVTYFPQQRQRQFHLPVVCFVQETGETQELLTLSGACFGPELKLAEDSVGFGQVVANSFLTKKVQLSNSGDLSAEFVWELGPNNNYLAVSPAKGVISPNEQVFFDLTFSPKTLADYKTACKLFVKGTDSPFTVTVTGRGIATPASSIETVAFETHVRTSAVKTVVVRNNSGFPWNLRPAINADSIDIKDYFSCPKSFEVPPNGTFPLNITYCPLSVLPERQNSLLFIPLSDGSALTYQLQGRPMPPKPEEPIAMTFRAKTTVTQSLTITNWLSVNQKFAVSFELGGSKAPLSEGILVSSVNLIEVAPGNSQTFKMSIFALKKGVFQLNIFLRNKENKEHLHYVLSLNVEESGVLKTFELSNFVRESKTLAISIENPLSANATIPPESISCDSRDIFISQKSPLVIKAQGEAYFEVVFRPLLTYKQQKALIRVTSAELGNFTFEVVLNSEKSSNVPTINFKASLGTDHTRHYGLINYLLKPAQYACKIERLSDNDTINNGPSDFNCETPSVNVPAAVSMSGIETGVNIRFEPSTVGVSKALLTISNAEGGEFQAYLVGSSSFPLPKGPFKVSSKGTSIEFKNTFYEAREFMVRIDNPNFTCSLKSPFKLEAKKSVALPLSFKPNGDNFTGRIVVETKDQISWIYYLQGL
jgi:hydrocephalus-inducing protein